jgi:hypothetical protein
MEKGGFFMRTPNEYWTWYDYKMAFISAAIDAGYKIRIKDNVIKATQNTMTLNMVRNGSWKMFYEHNFDYFRRMLKKYA